jgi:hypothetical protein
MGQSNNSYLVACHSSILKKNHQVELFECTFYLDLSDNEVKYVTGTRMFKAIN